MAKAAKITIAEVEEVVEVGEIDPDRVHLPGIFVHRIVKGQKFEKRIERLQVRKCEESSNSIVANNPGAILRERIARRAAMEFKNGMYGILFAWMMFFILVKLLRNFSLIKGSKLGNWNACSCFQLHS